MLVLIPVCNAETKVAGRVTKKTICETAGYVIKRTPDDDLKPYGRPCSVFTTSGREDGIQRVYRSPPDSILHYTASGIAQAKKPRPTHFEVHNIGEDFITFREFVGRKFRVSNHI